MNFFIQELSQNKKFIELVEQIAKKTSPIAISGLVDVEKIHSLLAISKETKRPICIVTYNEIQAKKLCQDISGFGEKAWYFPKREIAAYDYVAQSKDLPYERIAVLNQMVLAKKEKRPIIVVTTIEAVMQNMITKQELYQNMADFTVGKTYSLEKLKTTLVELGYDRVELVENKGQFCIRGGILDVGLSETIGVRIEFWGDEVDSIRYFKISSQRSTDMLKEITIFPAHELLVKDLKEAITRIEAKYPEEKEDIELIKSGDFTSKVDKYFNQFYTEQSDFLDYLSDEYLLLLDENSKIKQRQENIIIENNNLIDSLIEKERFVPEAIQNMSNFEYNLKEKQILYLEQNDILKNIIKFYFDTREINFHSLELEMLLSDLAIYQKEKKKVVILAGNEINSKKVCEILKEHEVNYSYIPNLIGENNKKTKEENKLQRKTEEIKEECSNGFKEENLKTGKILVTTRRTI